MGSSAGKAPASPFLPSDVNTDAANPKFVAALKAFQQSLSVQGYKINTAGQADWLSWASVFVLYCLQTNLGSTPAVTDAGLLALAQKALQDQTKVSVNENWPIDGTQNAGFTGALGVFQSELVQSGLTGLATGGRLDYLTLAGLLVQAYVMP